MDTNLAAWICCSRNHLPGWEEIAATLAQDMCILATIPKDVMDWFASVDDRCDLAALGLVETIRGRLLSRSVTGATLRAVVQIFCIIIAHPRMKPLIQHTSNRADCPVSWLLKALQRQLCAQTEHDVELDSIITELALDSIR